LNFGHRFGTIIPVGYNLRASPELKKAFKQYAKDHHRSMSEQIIYLMEQAVAGCLRIDEKQDGPKPPQPQPAPGQVSK
jgi:hypothetical protein